MNGELENGSSFDLTPKWLEEWEGENGNTYYHCGCGWRGTNPIKTEKLVNCSGGIEYETELRCPECGEVI